MEDLATAGGSFITAGLSFDEDLNKADLNPYKLVTTGLSNLLGCDFKTGSNNDAENLLSLSTRSVFQGYASFSLPDEDRILLKFW